MVRDFTTESLSHDPVHGYIPFVSPSGLPAGEVSEQQIIDHPWVQRLRQIHQLQTAWWVFPSAEHMRFQHVLGAMHLASRAIHEWYDSLADSCGSVPSRAYVESLLRMATLLHDVGHGPFGHFFDDHYLAQFGITHEDIGGVIIEHELGDLLRRLRRNPSGRLGPLEVIEPKQVAWLIRRPGKAESRESRVESRGSGLALDSQLSTLDPDEGQPDWLRKLRSLFSGIYTVDNMDFVLRDAYMSGYSQRAFDMSRLMHYSFFTPSGLTIHVRGLPTLINFIETRANLFRTIYFHRTVRALDLALEDVFAETMQRLFPGNPLEHLDQYRQLTEWSFLVDVGRWAAGEGPDDGSDLGRRWGDLFARKMNWKMACERTLQYHAGKSERTSIFSEPALVESRIRGFLPPDLKSMPLRIDVAKHYHRPSGRLPAGGQNFLLDPADGAPRELHDDDLFRSLPVSVSIFRVYAKDHAHDSLLNAALNSVLGDAEDAKTNM